jgi:peptidoglycan/xylan/chitin deacetylase (PgdA/CDA1 family)
LPKQANIIGLYDNPEFSAPIEYTLELILSVYGQSYEVMPFSRFKSEKRNPAGTLVISYGRKYLDSGAKKQIHIYASDFFGKDYLKPASMPETPLQKCEGLPVIYRGQGNISGWIRKSKGLVETDIDIIASSFFMLSRYEEVVLNTKDEHDRFPAKASLAYKEDFLHRPVVNQYIELLWGWLKSLSPDLERRPLWPQDKQFAVCLTHDVDEAFKYSSIPPLFRMGDAILKRKSSRLAMNILREYLSSLLHAEKDPFCNFDKIIEMERAYDFNSSFFFLARKEDPVSRRYDINNKHILREIRKLQDSGCEIGLHGSYTAYDNPEKLVEEHNKLAAIIGHIHGIRMHYLRFGIKETLGVLEQLAINYDCSIGFPYDAGFRSGIAFPYYLYNFATGKKSDIIEIPLIFSEPTLQGFMPSSIDKAIERIAEIIEMVRKHHGCVSILWHTHYFDNSSYPGYLQLYASAIESIHKNKGMGITCREAVELIEKGTKT